MGIAGQPAGVNAQRIEVVELGRVSFAQNAIDAPAGVHRQLWVLKHELHWAITLSRQGLFIQGDLAASGGQKARQQFTQGGFAVARGGHQPHHLPRCHGQ